MGESAKCRLEITHKPNSYHKSARGGYLLLNDLPGKYTGYYNNHFEYLSDYPAKGKILILGFSCSEQQSLCLYL